MTESEKIIKSLQIGIEYHEFEEDTSKEILSLINKYNALLEFIKYIANDSAKEIKFKEYGYEYSANMLLKNIGEL